MACLFAGNYATNTPPTLRAKNNDPPTDKPFNQNIQDVLSSGLVQTLQKKGITVLLSVLNAHTDTGWAQFADQATAQKFVNYLNSDVITRYGLDGIDIDDEYSDGKEHYTSLPMVTTLMKQTMPNKLITKTLFRDYNMFEAKWDGHTLGANLNYGWEMTYYGGSANDRLEFYTRHGMKKNQLCLGFSAANGDEKEIQKQAAETISEGYAGGMMFEYENQPRSIRLMKVMVDAMDGSGSWNKDPSCD